jgi:hypothetical protein
MAFNPDAYLAKQKSGFNPDAYLAKGAAKPESRAGQAALESYGNTASGGYLAQLQAMAEPITDQIINPFNFGGVNAPARQAVGVGPEYVEARDKNIKRGQEQAEAHPTASAVGTAAGIGASLLVPGQAVAKGASLGSKVAKGAKAGAAYGAAMNPGDTEGEIDPLQITERGENAAKGAAAGGTVAAAASILGPLSQKAASWFESKANEKAVAALGGGKRATEKLQRSGRDQQLGRTLLDEGAIPILGTPKRIAGRVDALKEKAGQEVGELVKSTGDAKLVNTRELATRISQDPDFANLTKTPGMESVAGDLKATLATFKKNGTMSLEQAQELRQGIDKSINFNKAPDQKGKQQILMKIRTAIRDRMDEAIGEVDGNPDGLLKSANKKYGNLAEAEDILKDRIARDSANRTVSLTDTIAGAAGLAKGGPLGAAVAGAANKAGRAFGRSVQARSSDALSKGLARGPAVAAFAQKNPTAYLTLLNALGGGPEFKETGADVLNDQKILGIFKNNPGLIDSVTDSKLRDKLKSVIGRDPADSAMKRRLSK